MKIKLIEILSSLFDSDKKINKKKIKKLNKARKKFNKKVEKTVK